MYRTEPHVDKVACNLVRVCSKVKVAAKLSRLHLSDIAMGSPNTIPRPVSPRAEGDVNENPSAIEYRTNDGGGPSHNQSSVGPAERHATIVLLNLSLYLSVHQYNGSIRQW